LEKSLAELITTPSIRSFLGEILDYCEDRYQNIVEKGKQDHLKITNDVQKYLINNILSEAVNTLIYNKLTQKLASEGKSMSTEIGLWATPGTWFAKYPYIKL
jgi:hypothetical protein